MNYCINPNCRQPNNSDNQIFCSACGSELLLKGKYRVVGKLLKSIFDTNYEVDDAGTAKVLKVLDRDKLAYISLFQHQAEVLQKFNHPGIPKVDPDGYFTFFPRGSQELLHCLVREKIAGETLQEWLDKRGRLVDQKLALQWLSQLVNILDEIHHNQCIHRNIKPSIIILKPNGQLALSDFGIVQKITATYIADIKAGRPGLKLYTLGYSAPEQIQGLAVLQSDFFSLGRTFVHLLTGKHPLEFEEFDFDTDKIYWRSAAHISPLLADFIDQLMAPSPSQRPANTQGILQRLKEIEQTLKNDLRQCQSISRDEALARIELVRENLLDLKVDAIVIPTSPGLYFDGGVGRQLLERLGSGLYKRLQNQPRPSLGEVLVTYASPLPAGYLFHIPIRKDVYATATTVFQSITAALTQAESIKDVKTIAFPSIGTGAAGLNPASLAPEILKIVTNYLQRGSRLEKVIFAFVDELAYQAYVNTYQTLLRESHLVYGISLTISPEATSIGGKIEVSISLKSVGGVDERDYIFQVPQSEAVGSELNIILNAPGFQFDGDNAINLPLATELSGEISPEQVTQTARFHLTALRPGSTTIKAELYCGETFQKSLETKVQVAGFDDAELRPLIAARSRPVPQSDLILQVRTAWNEDISACTFRYHIDTFQQRLLFADDSDYCSESLPAGWVERCLATSRSASTHLLLKTTLEDAASSLPEDFRSRLASLGQYLFERLLPAELQSIFRSIAGFNRPFTWLILADQDAWIPWELLHDGQTFLGDRFIIGRWLWELDKARPYEFPVGAVNVAHYASVEQPEVWTALLEPPGAPPPIPLSGGVLTDLSLTESMRGLHLIRFGQSSDIANRRDAPVLVNGSSGNLDIEREVQPAKLSLRRNRPLVTLGYVSAGQPELTVLEHTWASTFVRAGCSAFVGSLWAVQSDVEAAFVSGFYHNLWAGQSLGMAFQAARRLARAVAPESLDWLAYVLFGDPMARPYRPVEGQGYAVVEPIGQEIDDPVPPGATVRFRVSLRRTPPVWYENRLMEVAEDLAFEDLQVFIVTSGLQVTPADSVEMRRTPTGDYLGWFSLSVPQQMESQFVLVQVFFEDGMEPIHNLRFQVKVGNQNGERR